MVDSVCSITIRDGFPHPRRSVAFLKHPVVYVNIEDSFEALSASEQRYHFKSFDFWIGNHPNKRRWHSWNQSQQKGKYTECIVFKNVSEQERLYGFVCHPKDPDDRRYEMCVLVLSVTKKTWLTDTAELARANKMRDDPYVLAALKDLKLFTKGVGEAR